MNDPAKFNNAVSFLWAIAGLLYLLMERFNEKSKVDLRPASLSNHEMGYVFEHLLRKFNEALNKNPGEHFTPREVIRLMVGLQDSMLDSRKEETPAPVCRKRQRKDFRGLRTNVRSTGLGLQA